MKNNRVLSLIGLATKAGKTVSGEFSTEKSVKTGKGLLVIVAEDASENTKKKFRNIYKTIRALCQVPGSLFTVFYANAAKISRVISSALF